MTLVRALLHNSIDESWYLIQVSEVIESDRSLLAVPQMTYGSPEYLRE